MAQLGLVLCVGGEAAAVSEALASEYSSAGPDKKDAIASALASALDFSKDDANKALQGGAKNVAEAIATSRGGTTQAAAISASEVRLLLAWRQFVNSNMGMEGCSEGEGSVNGIKWTYMCCKHFLYVENKIVDKQLWMVGPGCVKVQGCYCKGSCDSLLNSQW